MSSMPTDQTMESPPFDGIICFGGVDWWYHNRGHYDLQIMREMSRRVPVLYVNSIGMRAPSAREGAMFLRRVGRKLKSLSRGLVEARPGFYVYSPIAPPGPGIESVSARNALAWQIKRAAKKCGISRPLAWIACPPAAHVIDKMTPVMTVYQRTDRTEEYTGVDRDYISRQDIRLKEHSDLVVFCARELYESEKAQCQRAVFVDHGVDFDSFSAAGIDYEEHGKEPEDLNGISHPRVGFVGGIDSHTFDPKLFTEVAVRLPGMQFVLVGACSLQAGWCSLPNVHFLGQRPYEEVPAYMAACDVLIMPWNRNEWIRACNPIKLKEYLAAGRPVVSSPFAELEFYSDRIHTAHNATEFVDRIVSCLKAPPDPTFQRERVREHGWDVKAQQIWATLSLLVRAG